MKRIIITCITLSFCTLLSAQNLIVNGDLEGTELTNFCVNDFVDNVKREFQEPRIISDDTGNHFIVVTTNNNYKNEYDSQLLITFPEPFEEGSNVKLSMKIKADRRQSAVMELHTMPGNWITHVGNNINITTIWTEYNITLHLTDFGVQTFAIDLSSRNGQNNIYFDDISVEVESIEKTRSEKYEHAWTISRNALIQKGAKSPALDSKYNSGIIYVFADNQQKCFAIVAAEPYAQCLDNPVLAYGINEYDWEMNLQVGPSGIQQSDDVVKVILEQYEKQLLYLYENNKRYNFNFNSVYKTKPEGITPLLKGIAYNQTDPYNKKFPSISYYGSKNKCRAGCTPVAMAQVLSYYHHPVTLNGLTTYSTSSGENYMTNLSQYPVKWDGSENDIANLIFACAASTNAVMGYPYTAAYISKVESALSEYWGYSRNCTTIRDKDETSTLTSIYKELDKEHPVIISGGHHAFVCDGYDQDYLHFNYGWEGKQNGYYRVIIIPEVSGNGLLHIDEILVGIVPKKWKK